MTKKSQKQHVDTISRAPGNRVKVARDVIETVEFGNIYGFYDVTGNFELDFQAIGCLYLGAASDFSLSFLEFFLRAISMKIGQVPHYEEQLIVR